MEHLSTVVLAGNDVDDENIGGRANNFGMDEFEFGIDEDLNTGRMGADRVHLDGDFFISDCDDVPDGGVGGKWMDVDPEIVELSVNGAMCQQFKLCQTELEQVKAQCKKVLNTEILQSMTL